MSSRHYIGRGECYFASFTRRTGPRTTRNVRRRAKGKKAHTRHVQYREVAARHVDSWLRGIPILSIR